MAVKIILTLLHLHLAARCIRSQVSMYTSNGVSCTPSFFLDRDIIALHNNIRGRIDCIRRCTCDVQCELAVYQEFQDRPASCTKLSYAQGDSSTGTLDVSTSSWCVAMFVSPCLNGGKLYQGVCLCQDGFAGETCEKSNPTFCNVDWIQVAASTSDGGTVYFPSVVNEFGWTNWKIYFQDDRLNVTSFMKGTKADRVLETHPDNWYFVTFPFFEKVAWNTFAENPQRQLIHVLFNGNYERLSLNGSEYSFLDGSMEFSFITPRHTRFATTRSMPEEWRKMTDDLNNGFGLFRGTWAREDLKTGTIVAQFVDRHPNTLVAGQFVDHPRILDFKYVLGQETYVCTTYMNDGLNSKLGTSAVRYINYLDSCWTRMKDDKYDGRASLIGWKMLATYLTLGHDVRVKVGPTYHTVLEVIQIGGSFYFVLSPFLSQSGTTRFTDPVYRVRSLISSSAIYQSCTQQIEGERVIEQSRYTSQYNVTWFVDTRNWNKVFVVSSNSSVLHGSVADLVSAVNKGSDVRVWIKWLSSDLSRFLDTHMSSVTGDGKVSSESLVTWRTAKTDTVVLSPKCDLEYILVTSEGHVEILSFNYLTPAKSEVQNDVIITWFLG